LSRDREHRENERRRTGIRAASKRVRERKRENRDEDEDELSRGRSGRREFFRAILSSRQLSETLEGQEYGKIARSTGDALLSVFSNEDDRRGARGGGSSLEKGELLPAGSRLDLLRSISSCTHTCLTTRACVCARDVSRITHHVYWTCVKRARARACLFARARGGEMSAQPVGFLRSAGSL
jgi:hypothetical protein